jgi:hypothetical protein
MRICGTQDPAHNINLSVFLFYRGFAKDSIIVQIEDKIQ